METMLYKSLQTGARMAEPTRFNGENHKDPYRP